MALTNRERLVMILAGFSIAILIGDRYVLGPIFEKRSQISQSKQTLQAEVEQAQAVLERRETLKQRWDHMKEMGLSYNVEKTEGLLFRHLEESSQRSRLLLTSIQPERILDEGVVGQVEFMVSGVGTMDAITRFLWDIEMADIPVKIDAMQLGANNENATQMSLQVKLSSIYLIEKSNDKDKQS